MQKYQIDEFINYIAPSHGRCVDMSTQIKSNDPAILFEQLPMEFANHFEWDNCTERAWPLMVWENKGEPVAYWDCEYCIGHFLTTA